MARSSGRRDSGAGPFVWRRFELGAFVAGAALLAWLLYRMGLGDLARQLSAVGWGFFVVVALGSLPILLNVLSWALLLPRRPRVPSRTLASMLLAGEAVNTVSPVGFIGGELVRVSLLRRWLDSAAAVGAVGLAATAQFAGQVIFILSGLPLVLSLVPQPGLRTALVLFGAASGLLLVSVLFVALSPGRLSSLRHLFGRFGWIERLRGRAPRAAYDAVTNGLRALRERPGAFALSTGASLAAWQVGIVETLLILRFLGQPVGLLRAAAIEILAVAIEGVLFFVPMKMGTQEGGRALIFIALGLDPAVGVALGLVRRARELAWAVPGFALLGSFQRSAGAPGGRPFALVTRGERPLPD